MTDQPSAQATAPEPLLQPARQGRWVWLIPLAALAFTAVLFATYMVKRGPVIGITMSHGHGIKAGDLLRCRGIVVGEVEHVRLGAALDGVEAKVRLDSAAAGIAVSGSRFWVVRPRLSLTRVGGMETIAGPRYLAVIPGEGARQKRFAALRTPPSIASLDEGGLQVLLRATERGSLRPGAPVTYRQVHIGTVLSVELSQDATQVHVRAYIEPRYAALVRANSIFWNVSGADLQLGLKGLRFEVESLQALLDGGVALATPDPPGERVANGHEFDLQRDADDDWLEWSPALEVGQ
jgi:paraquat-inducible protein B